MTFTRDDEPRLTWPVNGLNAVLDIVTRSHARAVFFLILACLVTFTPGAINTPPIDRTEARIAQATKQMIESGDYLGVRYQNEVDYRLGAGIHVLQAAVVRLAEAAGVPDARTRVALYRIPSLIGVTGAVLLTYWAALALVGRRAAYLAALMLGCSLLAAVQARLATADAMFLMSMVAALGALVRAYLADETEPRGALVALVFWASLAFGLFVNGLIALLIVGLPVLALLVRGQQANWISRLHPAIGAAALLIVLTPWAALLIARDGAAILSEPFRAAWTALTGADSWRTPPGFHLAVFWLAFWPAAPLAVLSVRTVWEERHEAGTEILLAWVLPAWIVFELVLAKTPQQVLPLYPAIAILIARTLERHALSDGPLRQRVTALWALVPFVLPATGIVLLIALRGHLGLIAWPFAAAAMIFGLRAWQLYKSDGAETSLLRATVASQLVIIAVLGAIVPLMRPAFPAAALARTISAAPCANPRVASAGYHEPSLAFLLGTDAVMTDGSGAADFLRGGECRFAFVEARQERHFVQRADATGARYVLVTQIEAVRPNLRPLLISVYRSLPEPASN